jgi:oxygen-independent coproporphyrinogen-3 oxidase
MTDKAEFQHIYIHWPFCKSRCSYCDFIALAQHEDFFEPYHQALCKEIDIVAGAAAENDPSIRFATQQVATQQVVTQITPSRRPKASDFAQVATTDRMAGTQDERLAGKSISNQKNAIETIFIGGGTPSLCPPQMLEEIFEKLHKNFDLSSTREITIETNPADITKEKLKCWKDFGINRLSMGVQVLDDQILKKLNRQQTSSDVFNAFELASEFFENISIDLILGLPDITENIWQKTLEQAVQWPIKHISIYFLTVYEKTPLYFKIQKGTIKLNDDDKLVALYEQTINFLEKNLFSQYEISNFAKSGYESVHNQAYWNRKSYYGFGLGASSFIFSADKQKRLSNQNNIGSYIRSIISNNLAPISTSETLNQEQIILETLMLSLRQKKGLDLHAVLYLLMGTQKVVFNKNIELLKKESLLEQNDNKIRLSFKGMIIENEVVLKLLEGLF